MRRASLTLIAGLGIGFLLWRIRIMWRDKREAASSDYRLQEQEGQTTDTISDSMQQPQPTVLEAPCEIEPDQQHYQDGYGPLFHRRYSVNFSHPGTTRETIMAYVQQNLHEFSPDLLAKFEKSKGDIRQMQIDDEYDITIAGPWNGTVRVADVKPCGFGFVTLEGHPEAGEISFRVEPYEASEDSSCFCIESLARSRDKLVGLSYREAGIGLEVQRRAWVTFCERVAAYAGTALDDVEVLTEELTND